MARKVKILGTRNLTLNTISWLVGNPATSSSCANIESIKRAVNEQYRKDNKKRRILVPPH